MPSSAEPSTRPLLVPEAALAKPAEAATALPGHPQEHLPHLIFHLIRIGNAVRGELPFHPVQHFLDVLARLGRQVFEGLFEIFINLGRLVGFLGRLLLLSGILFLGRLFVWLVGCLQR